MSAWQRLRQPWTLLGLACVLLVCAAAIDNLIFTDGLMGSSYHRTQTIWFVLGLIAAGVLAGVDIVFVRRLAPTLYQVLVILLAAVLVVGREINYSRRWIELGPLNLQPSEPMKLAVLLMLADWFDKKRATAPWRLRDLWLPGLYMMVPVILINREPDLGTSLVVAFVALSVILYEGVRGKGLILGLVIALIGAGLAWEFGVIRDYQKGRAEAWYQAIVEDDSLERKPASQRTQAEQALWAVGSGRVLGRTDEEARRSVLRHLPFVHTDFALAPFASRFGLVGCLVLFSLYAGIVAWALHLANRATERFDALMAVGIACLIYSQFFVNAGMVIGLLPVVGITLPLFSYGGSSALTVLLGVGLLVNIATRRKGRGGL